MHACLATQSKSGLNLEPPGDDYTDSAARFSVATPEMLPLRKRVVELTDGTPEHRRIESASFGTSNTFAEPVSRKRPSDRSLSIADLSAVKAAGTR